MKKKKEKKRKRKRDFNRMKQDLNASEGKEKLKRQVLQKDERDPVQAGRQSRCDGPQRRWKDVDQEDTKTHRQPERPGGGRVLNDFKLERF